MLFIKNIFDIIVELAPWLFLGSFIAGFLHIFIPKSFLYNSIGGYKLRHIVKASLLGVPIPLCSCSVLPTTVGIHKNGASKSASMSFLISTPQTGIDSFFVTASFLSLPFTIFKIISALILGIIGGIIFSFFEKEKFEKVNINNEYKEKKLTKKLYAIYQYAINDILRSFWKWLVIGIIISALITTFVPLDFFKDDWQISTTLAIVFALLSSIPLYICATSSVPIATALISAGFPPSAALVFLIAGPATNIVTIGLIYKSFGKLFLTIYLSVIIIGSILFGYLFDFLLIDISSTFIYTDTSYSIANYIFSGLFIALIIYFIYEEYFYSKKGSCNHS